MEPEVLSSPLQLTDAAGGRAPTTTAVGEKESTVNLSDVLENHLLLGLHPAVLTELAAPVEKVGGQEDGGGETGLLCHPVGFLEVRLDHVEREEGESHARELKYQ